jgi:hypothetical protein
MAGADKILARSHHACLSHLSSFLFLFDFFQAWLQGFEVVVDKVREREKRDDLVWFLMDPNLQGRVRKVKVVFIGNRNSKHLGLPKYWSHSSFLIKPEKRKECTR